MNINTIKKDDLLIAVTKDYQIINNSTDVSSLMSLITFLLHDSASKIAEFYKNNSEYEDIKREQLIERMATATQAYVLGESGMNSKDIEDVLGGGFNIKNTVEIT